MADLQIFKNPEFGAIRIIEKNTPEYMGYFYLMEYGDCLKIGSTKNPYQRVKQLVRQATKYGNSIIIGKVVLSAPHTNYRNNERILHEIFQLERRVGTELFNISLENALQVLEDSPITYEDKSDEMNKHSEYFTNAMKSFVLGGVENGLFKTVGK